MITSATHGLMSSLVQKMMQNYEKAQERISKEIDTMPIQSLIYYMNHVKQAFQHLHIEVAKNEMQKLQDAKEGVTVVKVKYSDTEAMFDKQVKNALREFGIPDDVIQQQNFKYG